jgi:pimeloyl-ACP methyl ester carboxylesterase
MCACDPLDPPAVPGLSGLDVDRRLLEVDGHHVAAEMHLLQQGCPPVVFLHGVLTSTCLVSELFDDPASASWISLSLPGHFGGRFAADITAASIDAALYVRLIEGALRQLVGSQRVILVGWSLGGFTAMAVTAAHPERVVAVASLAGFAEPRFAGVVWVMSWLVRTPGVASLVRLGLWLAGRLPSVFWIVCLLTAHNWPACRTESAKAALNGVWRRFRCHNTVSLAWVLATLYRLNIGDRVAGISCPVWIASGSHDPVVPLAEALRIADRLPQARLQVYKRAGHLFFCEWPGFRDGLADWITAVADS